ncbi:hypothetical protein C0J52_10132 [Blattella germanica]|nr:hypothetical protein C0J52_10132 [Blattella germanica]
MVDKAVLLSVYYAFIHSHLCYGTSLWGSHSSAFNVFKFQKKAVRIINKAHFRDHCKPIFISDKILTLPSIYILQCLLHIKKNSTDFTLKGNQILKNYQEK